MIRKKILGFGIAVILSFCVSAGFLYKRNTIASRSSDSVAILPRFADLGVAALHQPLPGTFQIRNSTSGPLTIFRLQPDCSCTILKPSKSELLPGEVIQIEFRVATNSTDKVRRRIELQTSAGIHYFEFTVRGVPHPNIKIDRESLEIPESKFGVAQHVDLSLEASNPSVKIISAQASSPWLTTKLTAGEEGHFKLFVEKSAEAPVGLISDKVVVTTTDPQSPKIYIPITAIVFDGFYITPNPLVFPKAKVGSKVELKVYIGGWGDFSPPVLQATHKNVAANYVGKSQNGALEYLMSTSPERDGLVSGMIVILKEGNVVKELPYLVSGEK